MKIMASSEALHKAATKVVRATPSLSGGSELLLETVGENGLLIRRQGSATYAEFFLYCSVTKPGSVLVHPDGLKFLQYEMGDIVLELKGTELKTHRGASIKTKEPDEFSHRREHPPLDEFWLVPAEASKILWASNPENLKFGYVYMSEKYVAVSDPDRGIVAVAIFDDHLPERKAIFPSEALEVFKDDEYVNANIDQRGIWLKSGGFVTHTIFAADQNAIPLQFDIISQASTDEVDYFSINREEFSRVLNKIRVHAKSSVHEGSSRCYLELREDGVLYLESNWSELGQVTETLKTTKSSGTIEVGMLPESLEQALRTLKGDQVNFYHMMMMGKSWPVVIEGNIRYTFFPYGLGFRLQNEL